MDDREGLADERAPARSRGVEVRRSALVAHPAERVYAVIEAAEDYPAFLPWCAAAHIVERSAEVVAARIHIAWRGVRFSFVTRNPKRAPLWMAIGLEEGPFRRFEGEWNLTRLGELGCRVEFRLGYEMNSSLLGALAGPVFQHAVDTLVDAFVRRADDVAAGRARVATEGAAQGPEAPEAPAIPSIASATEPPAVTPPSASAGGEGGIIATPEEKPE